MSYLALLLILPLAILAGRFESILPQWDFHSGAAPIVTTIWASGFIALLFKLGWEFFSLVRIRISSTRVEHREITECFAKAKRESGANSRVQLIASPHINGPVMIGWIFPTIVIPTAWLIGVPLEHLRAVFAHELGHVKRFDFPANLLQRIVEASLFFNPAAHWLSRIIRDEREHACDDFATSLVCCARDYSRALVWFESFRSSAHKAPALAAALGGKDDLSCRIQRVLRLSVSKSGKANPQLLLTITVGIISALSLIVLAGGTTLVAKGSMQLQAPIPESNLLVFVDPPPYIEVDELPFEQVLNAPIQWGARKQPLFTSIPIIKKGDILINIRKRAPRLFPEIPNHYLLENKLPFLDSTLPRRDLDKDGFNVLEEYQAGTNPQDDESHPAYSNKLKFLKRQSQVYRIEFVARPDEQRFQLRRLPSSKWPKRNNFYVKVGETTEDKQIRVDSLTEKVAKTTDGIIVDASVLTITFLPTGKKHQIVRNVTEEIPTYFAELRLDHHSGKSFYVKEGDEFVVPGDLEKWTLKSVEEEKCTISRKSGDNVVSQTIEKEK